MSIYLKSALAYAQRFGWHVFPVEPGGKTPLVKMWQKAASKKPQTINQWWMKWPNANIGVACGLSGLAVVDCDMKNGLDGIGAWRDLALEYDIDDNTVVQLTPSGGMHLVYQVNGTPIHNSASKLGPGIDTRGDGGYIVLAPSKMKDGKSYVWDVSAHPADTPLLPFPKKLSALLMDMERTASAPALPAGKSIYKGQRNETLASLAGTMRRRGMGEDAIRAALHAENVTKCDPPLPAEEVDRIAQSVSRYEPAISGMPRVFNLTDYGNAERLTNDHGHTLRYCHLWKRWLHWNGQRWVQDDSEEVMRRAKETVRQLYVEASQIQDTEEREAVTKWARGSESRSKLTAMIELAESESRMPVRPEQFDADPWALNVGNGTINLKTGELCEHHPGRLLTKQVTANYLPAAECPQWLAFLDRIMAGKAELIGFLRRAVGYSLTGSTGEQCLFILYGMGANGKSTFLETISGILNDYAMRTPTQTLMTRAKGSIPNDVARLRGARFVTAVEADESHLLAESMVKQMTGGERLAARFLNAEWFEFAPEFKIWLATNHKPEIRGTDHAIWRRIRLIPFAVTIPPAEQDKNLVEKLRREAAGILRWAIEGCLEWQKVGLQPPAEVARATDTYRAEMDVLAGFIDDCCIEDPDVITTAAELYAEYARWCDESGERALTKRAFGLRLKERGFDDTRGSGGTRCWRGLGLQARPNQKAMDM